MSLLVFGLVLLAALLHAVWNALMNGGTDKTAAMGVVVLGQGRSARRSRPSPPCRRPRACPISPSAWSCTPATGCS